MAQGKIGRNKKWCEKYKNSGTRCINKAKKQQKNQERIAKFAKRKEEGKCYEYKPNPYNKDGDKKEQNKYYREKRLRERKNVDHRLPISKLTSMLRLVQNDLDKKKEAAKQKERRAFKGKRKETVDE